MGWKTWGFIGVTIAFWTYTSLLPISKIILQPPIATENTPHTLLVKNRLENNQTFDIHLYLSTTSDIHFPEHILQDPFLENRKIPSFFLQESTENPCVRKQKNQNQVYYIFSIRSHYIAEKHGFCTYTLPAQHISICADAFSNATIMQFAEYDKTNTIIHKEKMTSQDMKFQIPKFLRNSNTTLYLIAFTNIINDNESYDNVLRDSWAFRPIVVPLTRVFIPDEFRNPTRFLLRDPYGIYQESVVLQEAYKEFQVTSYEELHSTRLSGLPKAILLTSVIENNLLSKERLEEAGLQYIMEKHYKNNYSHAFTPPFSIDSSISPRDESTVLVETNLLNLCSSVNDDTSHRYDINFQLKAIALGTWHLQELVHSSISHAATLLGNDVSYDIDSIHMMVGGGNPLLILSTFLISFLHLLFSMLAITSDVKYWKNLSLKNSEGVSSSSIVLEIIFSIFISLYLLDQGHSLLLFFLSLTKIGLDIWKVSILWTFSNHDDKIEMNNKEKKKIDDVSNVPTVIKSNSVIENSTETSITIKELVQFERTCLLKLIPLLILFVIIVMGYQLIYIPQRSWWSWIIHSLAVCAYAGGFLTMTPQLFRNYKLQSVEHLAWATLTYQALHAFVDDFFAFIIRMPKMHRLSVFRDDIIFIIYSIQRFMYSRRHKTIKID